ncbi:hypothetical protein [Cytobacillus oceanisediminis]|uniref:Uncharacterized protein n=1 Tax=Cytobacillus oceanisediminis TaxID=665099 RepID=A0A562J403_9BACI|nr:hypothetical protein [Cytobacillus oceanisediminis]TWH77872.1 hypothetical protein IQ19_05520 [Cytobacillus oceanisediminis]
MKITALKVLMTSAIVFPLIAGGTMSAQGEIGKPNIASAETQIKIDEGMTQPTFSFI